MFRRLAGVGLALALVCCAPDRGAPAAGARDDFGNAIHAGTTSTPARIVSLIPGTTQILFALGAGPRVVGRTHWDLAPDSVRRLPDLGPGLRPNIEAVLAVHPQLVVLYASSDNRESTAELRAAHIAVIALRTDHIADFRRATLLLGEATGERESARIVIDSVDRTLARVRAATASLPHPTVFWHIWDAPVITIGAGSFLNELVEIAGARNVYGDLPQVSPQVTIEDLVRRNPDFILAGPEGAAHIRASAEWHAVGAVRAGHVLVVDTSLVGTPSVRLGEAAVSLARLLHPGAM